MDVEGQVIGPRGSLQSGLIGGVTRVCEGLNSAETISGVRKFVTRKTPLEKRFAS